MSFLGGNPPSPAAGLAAAATRLGGGKSLGSRGNRTYALPRVTKTAPGSAPIEQSMTDKRVPIAAKGEASVAACRGRFLPDGEVCSLPALLR
jgi:hypothetical protein